MSKKLSQSHIYDFSFNVLRNSFPIIFYRKSNFSTIFSPISGIEKFFKHHHIIIIIIIYYINMYNVDYLLILILLLINCVVIIL
jgi:hypothetical protein